MEERMGANYDGIALRSLFLCAIGEEIGRQMRSSRLLAMILVSGALFAFLFFTTMIFNAAGPTLTNGTVIVIPAHGRSTMTVFSNRKHKVNRYLTINIRNYRDLESINKADYRGTPPSSRATIDHGPIEHGTPLMPYIPRSVPPPQPFHPKNGSPSPHEQTVAPCTNLF